MIDANIIHRIESPEFAFNLAVTGSRRRFRAALLQDETVRNLIADLMHNVEGQEQLAGRALMLANLDSDPRAQHPFDVALAVYLRVLDLAAPDFAESVAPTVARLPNVWWARPLAAKLLEPSRTFATQSSTSRQTGAFGGFVSITPVTDSTGTDSVVEYPVMNDSPRRVRFTTSVAATAIPQSILFGVATQRIRIDDTSELSGAAWK